METAQPNIKKPESSRSGFWRWLVVIIVVAAVVLGGLYLISKYSRFNVLGLGGGSGDWQAVFLSNGQVYFGKIVKESSKDVVVRDIYYLQVTQPLQRSGDQANQANQQNELSLVKLGNELHGPTDEMRINRDHVLFIENLKTDSRVVEAITNYKKGQQ
jgi:hypothetical protein